MTDKTLYFEDIVTLTAQESGEYKKYVRPVLKAFFRVVLRGLAAGYTIRLHGFGVFYHVQRKERIAKSGLTGQSYTVPPHVGYKFRVSNKSMEDAKSEIDE